MGAAGSVTFGIGPATKGKVDTRSGFSVVQARGGQVSDEVAVVNLTTKPLLINLYAADAVNAVDGTLTLQPRAMKPADAATWVVLKTPTGKPVVTVPPRATIVVPFTVHVPRNAYVGDHLAGIVASITSKGVGTGGRVTNVNFEQRIAVRLAVRVAGPLKPQLTIENLTASFVGTLNPVGAGSALVSYTVRNTGNLRLAGRVQVSIDGLLGNVTAQSVPDIPVLLPGGSATVSVPIAGVWASVRLTAHVAVTALVPAGDADPPVVDSSATVQFWAIPWLLIALIIIIFLAGLWLLRRRVSKTPPGGGRRTRASSATSAAKDREKMTVGARRSVAEPTT